MVWTGSDSSIKIWCPKMSKKKTKQELPMVGIVKSTYQPTKAEKEEEFTLEEMSLDEAVKRLLRPVQIRHTDKPE